MLRTAVQAAKVVERHYKEHSTKQLRTNSGISTVTHLIRSYKVHVEATGFKSYTSPALMSPPIRPERRRRLQWLCNATVKSRANPQTKRIGLTWISNSFESTSRFASLESHFTSFECSRGTQSCLVLITQHGKSSGGARFKSWAALFRYNSTRRTATRSILASACNPTHAMARPKSLWQIQMPSQARHPGSLGSSQSGSNGSTQRFLLLSYRPTGARPVHQQPAFHFPQATGKQLVFRRWSILRTVFSLAISGTSRPLVSPTCTRFRHRGIQSCNPATTLPARLPGFCDLSEYLMLSEHREADSLRPHTGDRATVRGYPFATTIIDELFIF